MFISQLLAMLLLYAMFSDAVLTPAQLLYESQAALLKKKYGGKVFLCELGVYVSDLSSRTRGGGGVLYDAV